MEKRINELWITVPGSYEETQRTLMRALRGSEEFGSVENEWDLSLEATFDGYCIVANTGGDEIVYYQADYSIDGDGNVIFSNVTRVEAKLALEAITESRLMENAINKNVTQMNELFDAEVVLEQAGEEKGKRKRRKGKVKVCQRANVPNSNRRIYAEDVLYNAYKDFSERVEKHGGSLMDSQHRIRDGQNYRDILKTVAVIKKVSWDPNEKTIGLDEIEILDTDDGRNLLALLESGVKVQVSQRAVGKSVTMVDEKTNKVYEKVTMLRIDGFDFVPPGEASVEEANFELLEGKKVEKELLKDVSVPEEVPIVSGVPVEDVPQNIQEADPAVMKSISEIQKKVESTSRDVATIMRERDLTFLDVVGKKVLDEILASDSYDRFTEKQKSIIKDSIDPKSLYGIVDCEDLGAIMERLRKLVDVEAQKADKYIAEVKLNTMGYKKGNLSEGISNVKVISEAKPWEEWCEKASAMVEERLIRKFNSKPVIDVNDSRVIQLLERFDDQFGAKLLLEAGEEVTQADIGPRIAMVSRTMALAAFRRQTALAVCETGTMLSRIEDIPIQTWLPAETSGRIDTDMALIEVGEGATIQKAGVSYSNYPLYATAKKLGAQITIEALATAKGTIMNPLADTIAGLTFDISRRIDRLLWQMQITMAQSYSVGQVTDWEILTRVGSTDTYRSANQGWLKYEWVKTVDANGNPTGARLVPLFGTGSGNTYQRIIVQTDEVSPKTLVYGDDYTINDSDGSITLTTAGVTKKGGADLEAKYTYTKNAFFWSMTPPSGVQLYDHLVNLRRAVGQASVAIGERNYEPNYVGFSLDTEDLVTSGPQFTESGKTPADILSQFNQVMTYAGKESIRSSAIPRNWIIVGVKGKTLYKIHTPIYLKGPITSATTGDDTYIAVEVSGTDIPVKDPFCVVGITG